MTAVAAAEPPQDPHTARTCFVIGPIGNKLAQAGSPALRAYEDSLETFEKVVLPACSKFGIDPLRADRIAHAGEITEQICRHVLQDDLVIADVSEGNANVMYELGLRHATGKPTIHIGEHGQLPFDIALIRTIQFTRSPSGLVDARKDLENALEGGIRSGFDLLTPARIHRALQAVDTETAIEGELSGEDDGTPGILDHLLALEDELGLLTADMESMSALIESIGTAADLSSAEMERTSRSGAPMSARMAVVTAYAGSISTPAQELERTATRFAKRMTTIDGGVRAALHLVEATPIEQRDQDARDFLAQVIGMAEATREGMDGLGLFGAAGESLGGMSRQLRGPGRCISTAVKRMTKSMAYIDEWERLARALQ
ncbi:hypothetical protein [Kitasatospora sp. NPDC087315]|uniref:hypothetical protein n=1 Tax=Kitasatospora sp. NPDC087315 TaxID=3364069 RepID=UPI0037FAD770